MQQSSHSRSQEKAVAAELEDEQRLLATVVRAHLDTCDFTRDKVAPVLARARETPNYTACPPTLVSTRGHFFFFSFFCFIHSFIFSHLAYCAHGDADQPQTHICVYIYIYIYIYICICVYIHVYAEAAQATE
jgi:hypothetical protein